MKLHEFGDTHDGKVEYMQHCSGCGKAYLVRTQHDNEPEYYTRVYVKCTACDDEWVKFNLPVN